MLPKKKELFCIELKNQHILEDKKKSDCFNERTIDKQ